MNRDQRTRHNQQSTSNWLEEAMLGGLGGGLLVGAGLLVLMVVSLILLGTGNAGDAILLCLLFPVALMLLVNKLK